MPDYVSTDPQWKKTDTARYQWDGVGWFRMNGAAPAAAGPAVGDQKIENNQLFQWNGTEWQPVVLPDTTGLGERAWEAAKVPLTSTLELLGRPNEFVTGTLAGTLQSGNLLEGLKRGAAAAFEPSLADSKIQESYGKVLSERSPEFAKAHPWVTAGAGFAGDVLLDPLNLLGGAGVIRKGLLKGAKAAGISEGVAKVALGLPIGEAFQGKVLPAAKEGVTSLRALWSPEARLQLLKTSKGVNAEEVKYLGTLAQRVANEKDLETLNSWARQHNLTEQDRLLIPEAIREPGGNAWDLLQRQIADEALQGSTRTADAVAGFKAMGSQVHARDVATGAVRPTWTPSAIMNPPTGKPGTASIVQSLQTSDKQALYDAFRLPGVIDDAGRITAQGQAQIQQFLKSKNVSGATTSAAQRLIRDLQPVVRSVDGRMLELPVVKFDTLAYDAKGVPIFSTERPNYVSQLAAPPAGAAVPGLQGAFHELSPALASSHEQAQSWSEYVQRGGSRDAIEILKKRFEASNKAAANIDIMRQYATEFGNKVGGAGYAKINPTTLNMLPESIRPLYKDTYFPSAVVEQVERVKQRMADFGNTEGFFRRGLKLWKAYRTTANLPAHQAGNFTGNLGAIYTATDHSADDILKAVAKSTQVVMGKGTFAPITVNGQTLTHADILKLAEEFGLGTEAKSVFSSAPAPLRVGGLESEVSGRRKMTATAERLFGQTSGPMVALNPENAAIRKVQELNQHYVEDPAKLALFYLDLKSGKTPEQAMLDIRKVLIDYNDLSDFEKSYMRDAVPFYTWTRKMLPTMLIGLAERPVKGVNQKRIFDLAHQLAADDDINKEDLPSYLQEPTTFPIPGLKGAEDQSVYGKLPLPITEIQKLSVDPENFVRQFGFMLNPFFRIPLEVVRKKQLGTPEYQTLADPNVPAGTLGRISGSLGLGALTGTWQDPRTDEYRQSAMTRYLMNEVPFPLMTGVRAFDPGGGAATGLNPFLEMLLRGAGLQPIGVSRQTEALGRREQTRKENE